MIGKRCGLLFVLSYSHTEKKRAYWRCRCDCGSEIIRMGKYLRRGEVKSCGCLNRQAIGGAPIKHGHTAGSKWTATYSTWSSMIQRCDNPKNSAYPKYGGRGIWVCLRWHEFQNFLADMGPRPVGKTIDRKNTLGSYEPSNCRWATPLEQGANQRKNRWILFNGYRLHLAAWARKLNVDASTLHRRIKHWGVERALSYVES